MATLVARPNEPLTIAEHWREYAHPLLGFSMFAADHPDAFVKESYFDPESQRRILVLRAGHEPAKREWNPNPGHLLFRAEDAPSIADVLARWMEIWHASHPSLALFVQALEEGRNYSPARFLALFSACESYWKKTKGSTTESWNIDRIYERATGHKPLTADEKRKLALIGESRQYHAHLTEPNTFPESEVMQTTYESTRRLHALMQSCLLRDIGFEATEVTRLLDEHYRGWPVP